MVPSASRAQNAINLHSVECKDHHILLQDDRLSVQKGVLNYKLFLMFFVGLHEKLSKITITNALMSILSDLA